jgi:hypothetical protein
MDFKGKMGSFNTSRTYARTIGIEGFLSWDFK